MSAKIMGEVYDLDLTTTEQSVLLALADHADHNGDNVRPGIELLVWKTGISERHVKRVLERLEAARIIIPRPGAAGGRGRVTEYSIRLGNGVKKPAFTRALPPAKSRRRKGDSLSLFSDAETVTHGHPLSAKRVPPSHPLFAERVTHSPTKGDSESVKGDSESSAPIRARLIHQEPSEEPEEREGRAHAAPPGEISRDFPQENAPRNGTMRPPAAPPASPPAPSPEEVRARLREIGQAEDFAAAFHSYYAERGWTSGRDRTPVSDWRKKLDLWIERERGFSGARAARAAAPATHGAAEAARIRQIMTNGLEADRGT